MNRRFAVFTAIFSVCAMAATLLAHDFRGSVVGVADTPARRVRTQSRASMSLPVLQTTIGSFGR